MHTKEVLDTINPHLDNRMRLIAVNYLDEMKKEMNKYFYKKIAESFGWGAIFGFMFAILFKFVWSHYN